MNSFEHGSPINIVQRFYAVDPLTEESTLADPADVQFEVDDPEGATTTYEFGVDANVTQVSTGVWLLALDPPLILGVYVYRAEGSGGDTGPVTDSGSFEIVSDREAAETGGVPIFGPCQPWADGEAVVACGADLGVGTDVWRLDDAAHDASVILFEISGRQFPGVCTKTVRPCADRTTCWHDGLQAYSWWGTDSTWRSEAGSRLCGCHRPSQVKLSGYPVRRITEVKIDGDVLAHLDDDSNPNWRLDKNRFLTRMDSPGPPVQRRFWPGCQNTSLNDTEAGTFSVSYEWGVEPPTLGRQAAAQLARELWLACSTGECKLPTKVTKIVRQGVTIERASSLAAMLRQGSTGLQVLDAFIATVNPHGVRRRPAVFSPDVQPFAKRLG